MVRGSIVIQPDGELSKCTLVTAERRLAALEIGVNETMTIHSFSWFQRYLCQEHGTIVHAGVELAILSARVSS